jgi:[acyl-carrier-protein] S-malonyltransferase
VSAAAHRCEVAIRNPGALFVIGGTIVQVDRLCEAALAAGTVRASRLPIAVASHTSRMDDAVVPFQHALDSAHLPIDCHAGGPCSADSMEPASRMQSRTPAGWPVSALANMARSLTGFREVRALDDFKTLDGVRRWITRVS